MSSMSQPAKRHQTDNVNKVLTYQSWWLFILVIIAIAIDSLWLNTSMIWAKSFVCGAVLNFFSQYVMTKLVFRYTGYQARQQTVSNLYLSALLRWVITIVGFIIIFNLVKPISAFAVLLGYMLIQMSNMLLLWRLR